jgi:phage tail sheath gpL-like
MALQFNQIPGNLRVPFVRFEVNAGQSPYQSIQRLVLIGQKTDGGSALANTPILVTSGEDGLFGYGSMLAAMYAIARKNAPFQEIWAVPLDDAAGATAASGSVRVSGAAPVANPGTVVLYIGGKRVAIPVNTVMTGANIAAAIASAVNACPGMQVTAAVDGVIDTKVNLTANNKGTLGNTILILPKFYADDGDFSQQLLTIVQMSGGAGDPSITNAIAAMGDGQFDWIVMPYCQSAYIGEIDSWLTSRWGPMSQTYGHCISAMTGTAGSVQAFTSALNSWHLSIMPAHNAPHPIYLWAAAVGAQTAAHLQDAPELSRPLQTIILEGLLPPVNLIDRWSDVERQSFYYAGASGYRVGSGGEVEIDRLITTYQRNAWGQVDQSWLDVNTIAQLMYGLPFIRQYLTSTYPRAALVDDNPNNIQGFATVKDIRNAFVHAYRSLESIGVFENSALFAQLLIVERNQQDPNRVDTYLPLDHVNALRVLAVNATTYQQYQNA